MINNNERRRYKHNEWMCDDILNLCKKNSIESEKESIDRRNISIAKKSPGYKKLVAPEKRIMYLDEDSQNITIVEKQEMKQEKKRKNWKILRAANLLDAGNGYSKSIFTLLFFRAS